MKIRPTYIKYVIAGVLMLGLQFFSPVTSDAQCAGNCGNEVIGPLCSCYCDDLCADLGDCCPDVFDECGIEPLNGFNFCFIPTIPTLSQWGLILLFVVLLILSVLGIKQMKGTRVLR